MPKPLPAKKRAEGLRLYAELGLAEAHRRTGVGKSTLRRWAKLAGILVDDAERTRAATEASVAVKAQVQAELREGLRIKLLEKAHDLLGRMDAPHVEFKGNHANQVEYPIAPAGAVKDYAIAFAVLLDKYRLEVGEATGRTETMSLTDGLSNDVKRELRERLARSARGESELDGTSGDPGRAAAGVDPGTAPGGATG